MTETTTAALAPGVTIDLRRGLVISAVCSVPAATR